MTPRRRQGAGEEAGGSCREEGAALTRSQEASRPSSEVSLGSPRPRTEGPVRHPRPQRPCVRLPGPRGSVPGRDPQSRPGLSELRRSAALVRAFLSGPCSARPHGSFGCCFWSVSTMNELRTGSAVWMYPVLTGRRSALCGGLLPAKGATGCCFHSQCCTLSSVRQFVTQWGSCWAYFGLSEAKSDVAASNTDR